jgi:hypothetical protein
MGCSGVSAVFVVASYSLDRDRRDAIPRNMGQGDRAVEHDRFDQRFDQRNRRKGLKYIAFNMLWYQNRESLPLRRVDRRIREIQARWRLELGRRTPPGYPEAAIRSPSVVRCVGSNR